MSHSRNLRWLATCTMITAAFSAVDCSRKSKSNCVTLGVEVAGSHPHSSDVPADHLKRGVGATYPLRDGDHEHVFVLSDSNMQTLQLGQSVTTRSSSVNGHVHEVKVSCKE
jgi:hypothetical protein